MRDIGSSANARNGFNVRPMTSASMQWLFYDVSVALYTPTFERSAALLHVDVCAQIGLMSPRNLVFGLIFLTRSRLWAAAQLISQNSDGCRHATGA
jgi:hypothetical protein